MFEEDEDYRKAKRECKARITKAIKVWSGREEAVRDASFKDGAEFGYNKGLEAGRTKWHDLRKNPKDVPLIEGRYLCILDYKRVHNMPVVLMYADDRLGHFVWVADDDDIYDGCVSRWAEIPKFKEE